MVYSEEAWFKTSTTSGGKIIGFGSNRTGSSGSYDRHVYMQDDGKLVFGTWTGQMNTITTPAAYNNDQWHHVVATQSGDGMKLYVDGVLVGTNPQTQAEGYTGYWKIGGDNTWGSSSAYFDGTIDEVAVYLSELSATRVAAHFAAAAPPVNQPPTADFTSTVSDLEVEFDAGDSEDPDGSITSYAWKFGDGETGTGETTSHTYDEAGDYTVELTVTDNDGATDVVEKDITVTAPNVDPTAEFTWTNSNLTASFNGVDSDDPDGDIESYAWKFGDNTTGTGISPNHTYAAAGTYQVELTVTDDDGATDSIIHDVTVTAPPVVAKDAYNRTVTDGWGSATTGGAWTLSGGAANFDVASGVGTMVTTTSAGRTATLNSVSARDVDLTAQFSYDKPGTGGGTYTSLMVRRVGTSDYRLKIRVAGTTTTATLVRTVNGTETTLATQNITGGIAANDAINIRLQVTGSGTTTLQGKVWIKGAAEPAAFGLNATDSTAALQNPGAVGIYHYLSSSATNSPVTLQVEDFEVRPQP